MDLHSSLILVNMLDFDHCLIENSRSARSAVSWDPHWRFPLGTLCIHAFTWTSVHPLGIHTFEVNICSRYAYGHVSSINTCTYNCARWRDTIAHFISIVNPINTSTYGLVCSIMWLCARWRTQICDSLWLVVRESSLAWVLHAIL